MLFTAEPFAQTASPPLGCGRQHSALNHWPLLTRLNQRLVGRKRCSVKLPSLLRFSQAIGGISFLMYARRLGILEKLCAGLWLSREHWLLSSIHFRSTVVSLEILSPFNCEFYCIRIMSSHSYYRILEDYADHLFYCLPNSLERKWMRSSCSWMIQSRIGRS